MNDLLNSARDYQQRGFSLLPMRMAEKRPAWRWKPFQEKRAGRRIIERWFGGDDPFGIGVIFGAISGGLASRDFDDQAAYLRWQSQYSDLASTLPTVVTRRGRHVYFRLRPDDEKRLRARLGKPDGVGAIDAGDGELRIGVGCYSVLPPSLHPEGHVYHWSKPLPQGPLPYLDPIEAGLFSCACDETEENGGYGGLQMVTEEISLVGLLGSIREAIVDSLPKKHGTRHKLVFALARSLKSIPALSDAQPLDLRQHVTEWHKLALPFIGTQPFEETWIDFLRAWPKVKFAKGAEPMRAIFETALRVAPPKQAERYEQPALRLLVALCQELQRRSGHVPFFLSCRTGGELLGVGHTTANRWLFLLVQERVLQEVEKGDRATRRASRYRFVEE